MEVPKTEAWSAHHQTSQYNVHLGLWTNWSRGRVLGQTLTISRRDGDLLIAFTAFFVAFVGSRFWRIAGLGFHRYHSSPGPKDAIHHQRQIVLRNATSADSALLLFAKMFWAWRRSSRLCLQVLPSFLLANFCVGAFTIAGGFSSQISSSAGTEILVDGSACGQIGRDAVGHSAETVYISQMVKNALNYVQQCYSNSTGLINCDAFVTERIPTYANNASSCPFDKKICRTDSSNLVLDTGLLDSHHHLGINAPPNERIFFRQVLHCAPLTTHGYVTSYASEHANYTLYEYGTSIWSTSNLNFTYKVKDVQYQYNHEAGDKPNSNYLVASFSSYALNGTTGFISDFIPRRELWRTDADTFLIFLSGNGVVFVEPMNDTWYHARDLDLSVGSASTSRKTYRPDEAASPLGCTEQFQFCFGSPKACGTLRGFIDAAAGAFELLGVNKGEVWDENAELLPETKTNPDASRFAWFASIVRYTVPSIADIFMESGPDALIATQILSGGVQAPLPVNQWQIDITHSWAMILALWQATFVDVARGPADPDLQATKIPPANSAQERMCFNQKIRSTSYASFNFFALLFTYILGLIIVAISFSLEPILGFLHRKWGYKTYEYLEWTTNATLQLHRLIHDDVYNKSLAWSRCVEAVPITTAGVHLAGLDISNIKHPKLKQSSEATTLIPMENLESSAEETPSQYIGSDSGLPVSPVSVRIQGDSALPELDQHSRRSSPTENVEMQDGNFLMGDRTDYQKVDQIPVDAANEEHNSPDHRSFSSRQISSLP
ncbi:hypothetical protein HD806DRAFT_458237 [Xylariaceae sp. AK1471]|nr:hypothetical protein HD806DRAFT_458237 [Xylariaceae sp. AK1471]